MLCCFVCVSVCVPVRACACVRTRLSVCLSALLQHWNVSSPNFCSNPTDVFLGFFSPRSVLQVNVNFSFLSVYYSGVRGPRQLRLGRKVYFYLLSKGTILALLLNQRDASGGPRPAVINSALCFSRWRTRFWKQAGVERQKTPPTSVRQPEDVKNIFSICFLFFFIFLYCVVFFLSFYCPMVAFALESQTSAVLYFVL